MRSTLAMINKAVAWLGANGEEPAFGGPRVEALARADRRDIAARLMPAIRKRISSSERKIGHFTDAPEVLEFVNSRDLQAAGRARHVLPGSFPAHQDPPARAAVRPGDANLDVVIASLDEALEAYRADYAAYYERCKHPEFAGDARSQRRRLSDPGSRHDHLRQGQGDGAHRRGVLRQRDQRDARRGQRQPICRACRAGSLQYRILAARGSQAAAHAEAEVARRPRRADHRRRGRHRHGDRGAADGRGRLRRARRHRPREPRCARSPNSASASARTRSPASRWTSPSEACGRGGDARRARRLRRPRHCRRQRRHRLGGGVRGHLAGALEPQHRDPRDRLFPHRARAAIAS